MTLESFAAHRQSTALNRRISFEAVAACDLSKSLESGKFGIHHTRQRQLRQSGTNSSHTQETLVGLNDSGFIRKEVSVSLTFLAGAEKVSIPQTSRTEDVFNGTRPSLSLGNSKVILQNTFGLRGCGFSQLFKDLRKKVSDSEHETEPVVAVRSHRCRLHTACGNMMAM